MDAVMVFVGTVYLAYVVGRWRERLRWEDAPWRGEPVYVGGVGYRVMQESVYQHLLAERGDPATEAHG